MILFNQYGLDEETNEITQTRMSLELGTPFKTALEVRDSESNTNISGQKVKPSKHGYTKADRDFNRLDEIWLQENVITEFLFDENQHYAGVRA